MEHSFSWALDKMFQGKNVTRLAFKNTCYIRIQFTGKDSMNTLPYIQMVKGKEVFPCNMSCENLLAKDWTFHEI